MRNVTAWIYDHFIAAANMILNAERKTALFTQARGIEVQKDSFSSCLVALCTGGFIIALLNKGYDIPRPLYGQDLESVPCRKPLFTLKEAPAPNKLSAPHMWGQGKVETGNSIYSAFLILKDKKCEWIQDTTVRWWVGCKVAHFARNNIKSVSPSYIKGIS